MGLYQTHAIRKQTLHPDGGSTIPVAPQILLVPVLPAPPRPLIEATAERLTAVFGREVGIVDPLAPPSLASAGAGFLDPALVCAALASTWGCGCRTRLVGVTGAQLLGGMSAVGDECGAVILIRLEPGEIGEVVRVVGRTLGHGTCSDPCCALHPGSDTLRLCRDCRSRL